MAPNHGSHLRNQPKVSEKDLNQANASSEINQFVATSNYSQAEQRLFHETFIIVRYVIHSLLSRKIERIPSPVEKKVRELTTEILAKHDVYNSLCMNINFTPENLEENFYGVAQNIFEDGLVNWGRLIALLGFSVKVAEYLSFKGFGNHDDLVIGMTTHFIVKRSCPWIQSKGGWEDVIYHFNINSRREDGVYLPHNATWFNSILTATATIGLGALLAVTCK